MKGWKVGKAKGRGGTAKLLTTADDDGCDRGRTAVRVLNADAESTPKVEVLGEACSIPCNCVVKQRATTTTTIGDNNNNNNNKQSNNNNNNNHNNNNKQQQQNK